MFRTLKFACKYVKERFNINYTEEGMVITLKRLGFRYKKPVIITGKISVDKDSNIQLLDKIITTHPELKKIYIFLDNAKSNKSKLFREYINNLTKVEVKLIYLPPYSPNLNLIKRLWKYSKKIILTAYYKTFNEFKNKVIDFFENEIKNQHHKDALKAFIGTNFHIIDPG
ncbi:MAG TPA: transposase [Spirochaetota bacterium]|nr:transposase [Spirochaetota bacterium]HPP04987.1 transposase [Spirochaetota bacterium]